MTRLLALAGLILAATTTVAAAQDRIAIPSDYRTSMVTYNSVERPDRNPKQIRFFYVDRPSYESAKASAVPYGTLLVMEDRRAKLGADGQPELDANGRFIPTDEVLALAAQKKMPGFGAAYKPELRNAEWEYAAFTPAGVLRPEVSPEPCLICHLNRTSRDYTFTFVKYLLDHNRP